MADVCPPLKDYQDSVRRLTRRLPAQLQDIRSPQEGKQVMSDYLGGFIARTEKVTSELRAAGTPDVPNADTEVQELTSGLQALTAAMKRARGKVDEIPTKNPRAFGRGIQEVVAGFQSEVSAIDESTVDFDSPQLRRAAGEEPACEGLT